MKILNDIHIQTIISSTKMIFLTDIFFIVEISTWCFYGATKMDWLESFRVNSYGFKAYNFYAITDDQSGYLYCV